MSAVTTTPAAVAAIAGSRNTTSEPGARVFIAQASAGTSGGWSA
ncbi:hypothetical protein [Amycolatopsis nalaikhensis]|uniref:Uncharacterized protein n=1 Tax=Amycolatopsis nalaikhensis TaxID=715472 RepID=A0ABY8Y3I1_9PSEU|nr:hypothetical protein [Amycolatopsis sp. 2-2]WIV62341.1 hypothetical protein QP939_32135 [Amycolatopsis sp. 2-2]